MDDKTKKLLQELFKRDAESAEEHCVQASRLHANWRRMLKECGFNDAEISTLWVELSL